MEAEEEKEVHLKKVIETKAGNIPVPVIEEVEDYSPHNFPIPEIYCKYHKDVNLEYFKTSEDYELMNSLKISESDYSEIINYFKNEIDDNRRVLDIKNNFNMFIYKKITDDLKYKFLIREECSECPSYVCFRRRILKPSRKNRRSETQAIEKITKLETELILLIKMCELNKNVYEKDNEILKVDFEIAQLSNEIINQKSNVKRKVKNILRGNSGNKLQNAIQGDLFNNILYNRDNIRVLKRKLNGIKNSFDEETKKEYIAYKKYIHDKLQK